MKTISFLILLLLSLPLLSNNAKSDSLQNALKVHIEKDDTINILSTSYALAMELREGNSYHEVLKILYSALEYYNKALEIFRNAGYAWGESNATNSSGSFNSNIW